MQRIERQLKGLEETLVKLNIIDLCEENQNKIMDKNNKTDLDMMECANCLGSRSLPYVRAFLCSDPKCDFYGRITMGKRLDVEQCQSFKDRVK